MDKFTHAKSELVTCIKITFSHICLNYHCALTVVNETHQAKSGSSGSTCCPSGHLQEYTAPESKQPITAGGESDGVSITAPEPAQFQVSSSEVINVFFVCSAIVKT